MDKINAIIVALVTILAVFVIIGAIVFVYPIVAGQQVTLPSGQAVKYKQGWRQYSFMWVSPDSPAYISVQGDLVVFADNFTPTINNSAGWEVAGGGEALSVAQGTTYNLSGFGLKITIISGVNSDNLVISVTSSSTSFWQITSIMYITVIAILLAVFIALLLLMRKRKTANLKQ
jgi:hypothetical protein